MLLRANQFPIHWAFRLSSRPLRCPTTFQYNSTMSGLAIQFDRIRPIQPDFVNPLSKKREVLLRSLAFTQSFACTDVLLALCTPKQLSLLAKPLALQTSANKSETSQILIASIYLMRKIATFPTWTLVHFFLGRHCLNMRLPWTGANLCCSRGHNFIQLHSMSWQVYPWKTPIQSNCLLISNTLLPFLPLLKTLVRKTKSFLDYYQLEPILHIQGLNKVYSKLRQPILLPLKHCIQFSCLHVALVFKKVDSKRRANPSITSEMWTFIQFTSVLTFPQMANCLWFVIWSGLNCVGSSFYRKNHLLPHHSLLTQTAV